MKAPISRRLNLGVLAGVTGLIALQVAVSTPNAQMPAAAAGSAPGSSLGQASNARAARDPGVRTGAASAGAPLAGLTPMQQQYFLASQEEFAGEEGVTEGLGPRMNLDSCGGCHSYPAIGGASPAVNPQVAFATKNGGTDQVPSFLTSNGPIRETRFVRNADGTPDGGVHAIFTISGRPGATACSLAQPDYDTEAGRHNVIFRIPTPAFGAGLIEAIPDSAILAAQTANAGAAAAAGVRGHANFQVSGRTISGQTNNNGNDGTIARFGWKAQNKSLLLFSGEAYSVEMGISNDLFQTERDETSACQFASVPNDVMNMEATTTLDTLSDVEKFAIFMRFLAPPARSTTTPGGAPSIANGEAVFNAVGCALCHTPSFKTGNSAVAALRNQDVALFSDLLVHNMGTGLADGVSQGEAGPMEFRSAPLWGLGQRLFLLHDGRTTDLMVAIAAHQSSGSEANSVMARFNALMAGQKQDLLNFLRSL